MISRQVNIVTLILIGLILISFAVGSLQVNRQAQKINKIIDQQSPLIFGFENAGPSGTLTFLVTCTRLEDASRYVCTTQTQSPPIPILTSTATPAPTTTPAPTATPAPTTTPVPR